MGDQKLVGWENKWVTERNIEEEGKGRITFVVSAGGQFEYFGKMLEVGAAEMIIWYSRVLEKWLNPSQLADQKTRWWCHIFGNVNQHMVMVTLNFLKAQF